MLERNLEAVSGRLEQHAVRSDSVDDAADASSLAMALDVRLAAVESAVAEDRAASDTWRGALAEEVQLTFSRLADDVAQRFLDGGLLSNLGLKTLTTAARKRKRRRKT